MHGVTVRTADAGDLTGIVELWRAAAHRESGTDNAESLATVLDHPYATVFVAFDGDTLVGSALPAWDGWRGTVHRVVVHPRSQRREEVGQALIAAGVEWLRQFGAVRVSAPVDGSAEARRLWEGAGFLHDPQTHRFVKDTDPRSGNGS
ncbi:GNAT family N-acetyltransferase [Kitasatospora sp. NPDC101157]|uniref:GNAT family N-acetyltransferase n=1 Tax=Kitasatospora sp. NPDC101157 TaxID=3364098 RepID=UPI00381D0E57